MQHANVTWDVTRRVKRRNNTHTAGWTLRISAFVPRTSWWQRLVVLGSLRRDAYGSKCLSDDLYHGRLVAFFSLGPLSCFAGRIFLLVFSLDDSRMKSVSVKHLSCGHERGDQATSKKLQRDIEICVNVKNDHCG